MVTKQEGLEVGCSASANASTASIGRRMQWMQQWMLAWPGIRQSQSQQRAAAGRVVPRSTCSSEQ